MGMEKNITVADLGKEGFRWHTFCVEATPNNCDLARYMARRVLAAFSRGHDRARPCVRIASVHIYWLVTTRVIHSVEEGMKYRTIQLSCLTFFTFPVSSLTFFPFPVSSRTLSRFSIPALHVSRFQSHVSHWGVGVVILGHCTKSAVCWTRTGRPVKWSKGGQDYGHAVRSRPFQVAVKINGQAGCERTVKRSR